MDRYAKTRHVTQTAGEVCADLVTDMADVYFFKGAAESIVEHCHERACYKPTCEWKAQIMVGGKFRHLGYFKGTAAGERDVALASGQVCFIQPNCVISEGYVCEKICGTRE